MNRLRLLDFRLSTGPAEIGICQTDVARCASFVNRAQTRLIFAREAGEYGWWGSWAKTVFNLNADENTITTPRSIARLANMSVCKHNINIQNQFYEFLDFGIGPQPRTCPENCNWLECYDRGTVITFDDLDTPPKIIRAVMVNSADAAKRVFISGTDSNDNVVYNLQGGIRHAGEFMALESPFVDSLIPYNSLTGIQKDITIGQVQFWQVDPLTSEQSLMLTMEPGETVAEYRRYYINGMPSSCCSTGNTVQVECMAKLELLPVYVDTDYLLIQNMEAIIHECNSIRFGAMEPASASAKSMEHHVMAIRALQGELVHYLGKSKPAISFKPFGSATLERASIGMT